MGSTAWGELVGQDAGNQFLEAETARLCARILLFIASAGKNRKARILRKAWIAGGKLAEKKCGTAGRFDGTRVHAIGTEALVESSLGQRGGFRHLKSLTGVECGSKIGADGMRLVSQRVYFAAANLLLPSLTFARNRRASS